MADPSVHDKDFLALGQFMAECPKILDIGANSGQSIRSFKAMRPLSIIDSFEPNPALRAELELTLQAYPDGVTLHFCGLSDEATELTFYTPVVDGKPRLQESSMYLAEFEKPWIKERLAKSGTTLSFDRFTASVKRGDEFGFSPDIIKIDVEGAELNALKGLEETLAGHSPVLLIENSDWGNVTRFTERLGYVTCMPGAELTGPVVPFRGQRANTIYIPPRLQHLIQR
jgi:FkbM family methyltransferase